MDAIMIRAVVNNLQALSGGRVERVFQPERDELHILIRASGQNHRLVMSASPSDARIHLTSYSRPNPPEPPMLCMLLRKLLASARLLSAEQIMLERVVKLTFECYDELGDKGELCIYVEIMGRHSNIIIVGADGNIIESARRVGADISSLRQVLPGLPYSLPPSQGKQNPLSLDASAIRAILSEYASGSLSRFLRERLMGLSSRNAEEIAYRAFAGITPSAPLSTSNLERLADVVSAFYADVRENRFSPMLLSEGNKAPMGFLPFAFASLSPALQHPQQSASAAVDAYYFQKTKATRMEQKARALSRSLAAHKDKAEKRLARQQEALHSGGKAEQLRIYGEMLIASLYSVKRGAKSATLHNYYTGEDIEIPLDERISPSANAQRYFRQYAKKKAARELAEQQLSSTQAELDYIESQLLNISRSTEEADLDEIRAELEREGIVRPQPRKTSGNKKPPETRPDEFNSSDGFTIFAGKNNTQNDRLTLSSAPEDVWLHAKNIPGSHVIIKAGKSAPSDTAIWEAAVIAAYYSKSRASENVPVDYCSRKFVKKPSGAKPGMVIYTNQKTVYVTPDEDMVKRLKV